MSQTHHQDIVFTMQVYFFFGIALCLVVDTSTKSVRSIYNVTTEPESPPNSVQQGRGTCENDDSCENGVSCVSNKGGKFCKCLRGIEGHFCENILDCEKLKCKEGQAQCIYDKTDEEAKCSCEVKTLNFDYEIGICRDTCIDETSCSNGATCVENRGGKFCKCLPGTEGHFCDEVVDCDKLKCTEGNAECEYDIQERIAKCVCDIKTLNFDYENGTCRKSCHVTEVCENGGDCVDTDGGSFCRCRTGTTGDLCETVPECNNKDCGPDAVCVYDVKRGNAVCHCNNDALSFDKVDKKCKKSCKDENCENQGVCSTTFDGSFCRCKPGTEGDLCDIVPECQKKDCGNQATCVYDNRQEKAVCHCINYRLLFDPDDKICKLCDCGVYSSSCKYEDGKKICDCYSGSAVKNGTCEICDCGEYSSSCKYEDGKKVCDCYPGYGDNNGKCESCICGRNTLSCSFEDGKKICDCLPGYGDKNGRCEDCDCGNDTFSCNFDENGEKACVCDFGYADNDGKCEICDCGNNSFSCGFADGKKVCNCHRFHGQKDGQCEVCFCGIDIQSCRYNERGNKVCDCPEGYIEINGICEKIPFPSTFIPTEITSNATRNSSVEHTWVFTTSNRNSAASSTTIRPTDADPCIANLCQNGGTCVFVDNKSKCLCKKPYLGILCETDPCDWNPCMNNGVCKIEKEEVKCYCKAPFAGKFCEAPIKLDAYVVTLVAASVFSAIVLIFVTCVLCQRCRVVGTN